jgi:hypothetical protein
MESEGEKQPVGFVEWLSLICLTVGALLLYNPLPPWAFMWSLAIAIYLGLKWQTWWRARTKAPHAAWRSAAYLLAWPGMDARSFLDEDNRVARQRPLKWFWAIAETGLGVVFLWVVARAIPEGRPLLRGWVGMLGIILILHFGIFQVVALFWQAFGIAALPIMSAPLRSRSLSEFWGKRWNLGFRQLAHDLLFGPLHRKLGAQKTGFLVFVLSGLIHDLVISVPARGGYGLPTAYFAIQGIGVMAERTQIGKRLGLGQGPAGYFFTAVFTAGPLFWLFHPPFVLHVIIPFMKAIRAL